MISRFLLNRRTFFIYFALTLIIVIGLYCRFYYVLNVEFFDYYNGTEFSQNEYYFIKMTKNILDHYHYGYFEVPDAGVMPGYPIFLAIIMMVFGTESTGVFAVRVLQVLISTGTILLVYLLTIKILKNRGAGLFAATLIAFYPPLILYSRFILTETIYIFFVIFYFMIQLSALEKRESSFHIGAGVLLGISVLFRPMIFVLLPLPYTYMFIANKEQMERLYVLKNFAFFIFSFAVVIFPWWVRNMISLDRFVLFSEYNRHLDLNFRTIFAKLEILFVESAYYLPDSYTFLSDITGALHMYIIALGSVGLIGGLFNKKLRLFSIYICFYIMLSLLFVPSARYGLQYIPFLTIFAVYAMFKVFKTAKVRGERQ